MNLTISPLNHNNYQYRKNNPQTFTAKMDDAEKIIANAGKKSGLFAPFEKSYDRFTDVIADKFTSRFVELKPLNWLADKFKDSKNLFQHCLTVGSVVTSGLYIQRTLTNKDMDKDRKNTLAVNQGLTFLLSTAGAYGLDKYVKGWWDNVTARFAGHLLGDADFFKKYKAEKENVKKINEELQKTAAKGSNIELKEQPNVIKWVKNHPTFKNLVSDDADILLKKVKGMSPLRTMLVFGFVYRFFVPVVVTKPANKLCEIYLENKKKNNSEQKTA